MPPSTEDNITGYELSRNWFDWCYGNPEKISPTHTAMYFLYYRALEIGWDKRINSACHLK